MQNVQWSLRQLLEFMKYDLVSIPAFQRDPVWKWKQNRLLIDSILKNLPIGAITLGRTTFPIAVYPWKHEVHKKKPHWVEQFACEEVNFEQIAEKAREKLRRIGDPEVDTYLVLDGQQRMTAIYEAFHADAGPTYTVLFKPEAKSFSSLEFLADYSMGIADTPRTTQSEGYAWRTSRYATRSERYK